MPELVALSSVENEESLKMYLNQQFDRGHYAEIGQAIGMYSILMDPEHMIKDQDHLYHLVLNLLKKKIGRERPKAYSSWLPAFPSLLADIVQSGRIVTGEAARNALASRHAAFGSFSSLDEFYFWALDDRRLPLDQIVRYVQTTVDAFNAQKGS